jgi:hypothetical protein
MKVGDIRKAIAGVPDDVDVYINVEEDSETNWDAFGESYIQNDSYLCEGHDGCTHTEPEMLWDIIIFVKSKKNERTIPLGRTISPTIDPRMYSPGEPEEGLYDPSRER